MEKQDLQNKSFKPEAKVEKKETPKKVAKKEYELLSKGQWIPMSAEDLGDGLDKGLGDGTVRKA